MIRQTSIEALQQIRESGVLSKRRFEVYVSLFEYGPCSATELFYKMNKLRNPSHSNVTTRLGELREMGVVKEIGTKICTITEKKVIEWDVTANLPIKFEKSKEHKCPTCKGTGKVIMHQGKLL